MNEKEEREKAIKKYEELKNQYGLPALHLLEDEFDFKLEDDNAISKTIINQIWEKISSIKSYVEGILNPQRYCCMIETKFLNAKEKEKLFNYYKKIMIEYWKTVQSTFGTNDEKTKQIINSYEFYKKVKAFSKDYLQRMVKGWSEEDKEEKQENYIS